MDKNILAQIGANVREELIGLFVGDLISYGMSRWVFNMATDDTKVIKIENAAGHFQNPLEWETWKAFKDGQQAKWLAPVHWISSCGSVLIMSKTTPLPPNKKIEKLPAWMGDHKRENFGILNGKVVCHDYGTTNLFYHAKCALHKWHEPKTKI